MNPNASSLVIQRPGLPPFLQTFQAASLRWREASGIGQGGPADASAGLSKVQGTFRGEAATWAWNPIDAEWQLCHILTDRNTLWDMGGHYYGTKSRANVHRIGNVEQNRAIIGADSDYAQGVPGDILLIPGLAQPSGLTPQPPPGGSVPEPGGAVPPLPPSEPGGRPPGYPPDWEWPPGWSTSPVEPPAELPGLPEPTEPGGAVPTPIGADTGTTGRTSWWTPAKIALVGGMGVATLGLIVWGVVNAGKPRLRRKPKPRKSTRRRRR